MSSIMDYPHKPVISEIIHIVSLYSHIDKHNTHHVLGSMRVPCISDEQSMPGTSICTKRAEHVYMYMSNIN